MGKRIKLICIYDLLESRFKRRFILSATTKIDYIINVLNRMGFGVDIISAAEAEGGQLSFCPTQKTKLGTNTLVTFGCISLPHKKLTRKISSAIVTRKFENYLRENLTPDDIVIAYHSPRYAGFLTELRKKRNFTLIGEIEEIYQDVRDMGGKLNSAEYDFFAACDKYIFPTQLLNEKLNLNGDKPSITIHGLYNIEPDRKLKFADNRVHVVYAGTFDPQKGGAAAAVGAAAFLPENYHVHICGFGSEDATKNIKAIIEETQLKSKATLSFDGLLKGEEFIRFIQKCEIGLSTQNPDAAFNATSFPSKVLNYLSNGLKVVTIDIPAIRLSGVGKNLYYYQNQTPENIARAIVEAHESQYDKESDGRALLQKLDKQFESDLKIFLQ